MDGWRKKVGKCLQKKRKKEATFPAQALSCSGSTGIISALPPTGGIAPRELKNTGFPPAKQRYVTWNFLQRLIKMMQHLWNLRVIYLTNSSLKGVNMKKVIFAAVAIFSLLAGYGQSGD